MGKPLIFSPSSLNHRPSTSFLGLPSFRPARNQPRQTCLMHLPRHTPLVTELAFQPLTSEFSFPISVLRSQVAALRPRAVCLMPQACWLWLNHRSTETPSHRTTFPPSLFPASRLLPRAVCLMHPRSPHLTHHYDFVASVYLMPCAFSFSLSRQTGHSKTPRTSSSLSSTGAKHTQKHNTVGPDVTGFFPHDFSEGAGNSFVIILRE